MTDVPIADTFQFDAQGFFILRDAFDAERCRHYLAELDRLFEQEYTDNWLADGNVKGQTTVQLTEGQRRINGLPLWTDVFDDVISFPPVIDRLRAWMQAPQLINTWAIDKTIGTPWGGWHRGLNPDDYSVRQGKVRSRMLNCVYMLTDNDEEDGCLVVVPGAHKSEIDLPMARLPWQGASRNGPGRGKSRRYGHVHGDPVSHRCAKDEFTTTHESVFQLHRRHLQPRHARVARRE